MAQWDAGLIISITYVSIITIVSFRNLHDQNKNNQPFRSQAV
jgi:hypothetical protein